MVHISFVRKRLTVWLRAITCVGLLIFVFYRVKHRFFSYTEQSYRNDEYGTRPQISIGNHNGGRSNDTSQGLLDIHRWNSVCGYTVDNLRQSIFFPKVPNWRSSINGLQFSSKEENFGQRIFGYIRAPSTGLYHFAICSDDSSELWLSTDSDPDNSTLICHVGAGNAVLGWTREGEFGKYKSQTSRDIYLERGKKYFVEVLHKQGEGLGHFHVVWKLPRTEKFIDIKSEFLFRYVQGQQSFSDYGQIISRQHQIVSENKHILGHLKNSTRKLHSKNLLKYCRGYDKLLPNCITSNGKIKIRRYDGINHIRSPFVYPADGSNQLLHKCQGTNQPKVMCVGNPLLSEQNASSIVRKFMEETLPRKYSLKSIISVEEYKIAYGKKNPIYKHYFLDFEIVDENSGQVLRIADPVWEHSKERKLCNPAEHSWNPNTMVYIIVTAKNQGLWVRHFIDTVELIQEANNDSNIHPIIVDFGNKDVGPNDTEIYLRRSKLKHYTIIHKSGKFFKTAAINEAAASVEDENSILFQLDLHLDLPLNLIDTVRKHTIKNKVAFSPVLTRLMCGSSSSSPVGYWEIEGFGLFAVYKSDWIRFGGMNEKEYGKSWGGDDSEMLDRVIMDGIEVHSQKVPGLFHFYHTKRDLWQNSN